MSYGETVVDEDYGNQKTFIWCECGNELWSTNSWLEYESKEIVEKIDVETMMGLIEEHNKKMNELKRQHGKSYSKRYR